MNAASDAHGTIPESPATLRFGTRDPGHDVAANPNESNVATAVVASAAFGLLIAQSNLPTPLLPVYRDRLGLDALTLSFVFASYLIVLVATLAVMASATTRRWRDRGAIVVLPAALVVAVVADGLLISGTTGSIVAGRMLTGLAVGLGTGSAATLTVASIGERGRTSVATGTLMGALMGTAVAAVAVTWFPAPTSTIFAVHIGLVLAVLVLLVTLLGRRPRTNRAVASRRARAPTPANVAIGDARPPMVAFAFGALSWSLAAVVVGMVPATLRSAGHDSIMVVTLPAIAILAAGSSAQQAMRRWPRPFGPIPALAAMAAGFVALTVGVVTASVPVAIAGAFLGGAGQGPSYRIGLDRATRGLTPQRHGAVTSAYACTSYGVAAAVTLVGGTVARSTSDAAGTTTLAIVFGLATAGTAFAFCHRLT